ncbi:hypothetical protein D3C87_2071920 [compost metagenome]
MIGVGVGFQQPLGVQPVLPHVVHHPVRAGGVAAPGLRVVVQHGIDDGAGAAVMHHVGNGGGDRVEEGLDMWIHGGPRISIYVFK